MYLLDDLELLKAPIGHQLIFQRLPQHYLCVDGKTARGPETG
jgi:hypothetical protein